MNNIITVYKLNSAQDYFNVIRLIEKHFKLDYLENYKLSAEKALKNKGGGFCNYLAILETGRPWVLNEVNIIPSSKKEFIQLCRQKLDKKFIKPSKLWLKLK